MEKLYECERCGTAVYEKYGEQGRFCSRGCANKRDHSAETKLKIAESVKDNRKKPRAKGGYDNSVYTCADCGKQVQGIGPFKLHTRTHSEDYINAKLDEYVQSHLKTPLDITRRELEAYKSTHKLCEVCKRDLSKIPYLCVDHCHDTNKFRGLLCPNCNTKLGWYQKHKEAIDAYLDK